MFHEPSPQFFYSSYRIIIEHSDGVNSVTSSATAFILEVAKGIPWIVTNRHVIDLNYNQSSNKFRHFKPSKVLIIGRDLSDNEYSYELYEKAEFFYHGERENDVVMIESRVMNSVKPFHWHFGLEHLADDKIFETVLPFDLICFTGFPKTHDKYKNRPILRSGRIASDPKFEYSWNNEYQGQCVAYEGFSSSGASGSPVFAPSRGLQTIPNSRHGYLVGVNAGHIPDQYGHSGISYFYKSTVILEIIEQNSLDKKLTPRDTKEH